VIRQIFRRYLVSKLRSSGGRARVNGYPFSRGALYVVLSNRLYIGEVRHRGVRYPGQHQAIIDRELWDRVQEQLQAHATRRRLRAVKVEPSPLMGKLFDTSGAGLTPSHARKDARRYRYYISRGLTIGSAHGVRDGWRLAHEDHPQRATLNPISIRNQRQGHHGNPRRQLCANSRRLRIFLFSNLFR
jgi:hypothetical protein